MKTVRILVVLFIFSVLLVFGIIGVLAEPIDVQYNYGEFIAIKLISFFVVFIAYKCLVATFQVIREGRVT